MNENIGRALGGPTISCQKEVEYCLIETNISMVDNRLIQIAPFPKYFASSKSEDEIEVKCLRFRELSIS